MIDRSNNRKNSYRKKNDKRRAVIDNSLIRLCLSKLTARELNIAVEIFANAKDSNGKVVNVELNRLKDNSRYHTDTWVVFRKALDKVCDVLLNPVVIESRSFDDNESFETSLKEISIFSRLEVLGNTLAICSKDLYFGNKNNKFPSGNFTSISCASFESITSKHAKLLYLRFLQYADNGRVFLPFSVIKAMGLAATPSEFNTKVLPKCKPILEEHFGEIGIKEIYNKSNTRIISYDFFFRPTRIKGSSFRSKENGYDIARRKISPYMLARTLGYEIVDDEIDCCFDNIDYRFHLYDDAFRSFAPVLVLDCFEFMKKLKGYNPKEALEFFNKEFSLELHDVTEEIEETIVNTDKEAYPWDKPLAEDDYPDFLQNEPSHQKGGFYNAKKCTPKGFTEVRDDDIPF